MTLDSIAGSPVGERMLDDLAFDGFPTGRPLTDLSEAALYEYATRAAVEVSSEKWSSSPGRDWPWEERISHDQGKRLGRAVPACNAARWWSDSFASRPQVWVGRAAAAPTAGVATGAAGGKPPTEIWTSSAVAGLPCAWWSVLKNGADSAPPVGPQSIWRLTSHPDAHVYEIRDPRDWRWLCDTFPAPIVGGFAQPLWSAVAEQFDGVHLTVEGLIRVQGVVVETDRGLSMLDNWDSESTAWLRWSVVDLERLGTVTSPRSPSKAPLRRGRAVPRALRRS